VAIAGGQAAGTARRPGGLLWHRNFRLLWFGETISSIGSAMAAVGVPLLAVVVLHASTFAVSALTAAAYAPWLVIGLPAGAWVDRMSPRPLMVASDLASMALFASLPVAAWAGALSVGLVLAVALLAGTANVFFGTAYQVYLADLVRAEDLLEGNAKLQGSQSVAGISGRGLAGLAAEAVGYSAALLFNAGSFLVSAVCLLLIRAEAPARERVAGAASGRAGTAPATSVREDIAEGVSFIWHDQIMLRLTLFPAASNLAYGGAMAIVVVFLVREAHFASAAVGLLMAASGVGGLLGALVARRVAQRVGTARTVLLTVLVGGLSGLLIPLTATGPRAALYVAGTGIVAASIAVANVVMISFRQTYCPAGMLGRVSASQRFVAFGVTPLGALLAGGLGTVLGVRAALWVMLVGFALSGTLLLARPFLADRNLPTGPATPVTADSRTA
jgi:MFS family permease